MSVTINGTTGISKVQDNIITSSSIVDGSITNTDLTTPYRMVQGTAVASTSGTYIDFTGIPSWAKRITVMFNGVSTNGTSFVQVQLGSGSITTSGYVGSIGLYNNSNGTGIGSITSGFVISGSNASDSRYGVLQLLKLDSNIWIANGTNYAASLIYKGNTDGAVTLSGTLDRIRITTVNGTDTFDAGSINIMWEG